ncbi:MAG TPA: DUF4129 domain-containing protein [Thermoanaerobaculia bacterium]|nr:DUF4129 domain-containing protein [Thermoanaerobaculia bacterium]
MNGSRQGRPGGAPRPALAARLVRAWPVALATLVALSSGTPAADAAGARAATAAAAAAATISAADYRRRLIEIRAHLGRGDWEAARRQAQRLAGQRVAFGRDAADELEPDLSVLRPLANAHDRAAASKAALPLARLIGALPVGPEAAPAAGSATTPAAALAARPRADAALLERLRRSQELAEIAAGGSLPDPGVGGDGVLDAVRNFLRPPARLLASLWDGLRHWMERWLRRLLEGARRRRPAFGLRGVVFLAVLLALAMLAAVVQAARRRHRRRRPATVTAAPMTGPAQDDDPLSRASGQWESYARDLAAAGRFREAIRAWYHAVLVTLYQRGIVHYRKGRTNWEYLATIPSATSWRPALVEMTRHFEREWYGRDRSSPEALADSQALARRLLRELGSSPA